MPVANMTVTAKTGPADQITALVLNNIVSMTLEPGGQVLKVKKSDNTFLDVDMNGVTTFTVSISGGNFTITIS